jgi:phage major head subunit gpT-like protein
MFFGIDNVLTTQDELIGVMVNRYDQIMMDPGLLYWDLLTEDFSTSKRKRLLNWIQSFAVLRLAAGGAQRSYDDIVDAAAELSADNYEGSLSVDQNAYEDDDLDRVTAWAQSQGDYEAIFWQDLLQEILAQGETILGYDKVPMFSTLHPVEIGVDGTATNSNLWSGYAPTVAGLATLTKEIKGTLKTAGLKNAYIRPYRLWVNPQSEFTAIESLNAQIIGNAAASNINGSKSNVMADQMIKNKYGWAGGIQVMQDHPMEDSYYVECQIVGRSPFSKPFARVIRKMFEMRMYSKQDQVILGRSNKSEWQKDGRVAMRPGEPMCLHKVTF